MYTEPSKRAADAPVKERRFLIIAHPVQPGMDPIPTLQHGLGDKRTPHLSGTVKRPLAQTRQAEHRRDQHAGGQTQPYP